MSTQTQNEIGGKSLLLKAAKNFTGATTNSGSPSIGLTAHGAAVGDMFVPTAVGSISTLTVGTVYWVVTVVDANTLKVSATIGGMAVNPDFTGAVLAADIYSNVGAIKAKSIAFKTKGINTTNQDSSEWEMMLDNAGIRSMSVSGSGVYSGDVVMENLKVASMNNTLAQLAFIDVIKKKVYYGFYKVTQLQLSGNFDGEGNYSLSAESSGVITFLQAA